MVYRIELVYQNRLIGFCGYCSLINGPLGHQGRGESIFKWHSWAFESVPLIEKWGSEYKRIFLLCQIISLILNSGRLICWSTIGLCCQTAFSRTGRDLGTKPKIQTFDFLISCKDFGILWTHFSPPLLQGTQPIADFWHPPQHGCWYLEATEVLVHLMVYMTELLKTLPSLSAKTGFLDSWGSIILEAISQE